MGFDSVGKSLFITGGAGLLALNWAIAIRDRYQVNLGLHNRRVSLADVQSLSVDLESVTAVRAALERVHAHVVIHTAGLTDVSACEKNPRLAQSVNVELSANVARACFKAGLPLVHISTDHLFAGNQAFLDENHRTSPVNVYGRTKAEAEVRVLDEHPQAMVVRTNFYGWGTSYRQSFSDFIIESLRIGRDLTLFKDVFYTPILIEEVSFAVHELIDRGAHGIFNIAGDDRISKYEFGLLLAEEFDLDASRISGGLLENCSSEVKRPLDMSLSNKKICNLLGRKLGGVKEQIVKLHRQEKNGLLQELKKL